MIKTHKTVLCSVKGEFCFACVVEDIYANGNDCITLLKPCLSACFDHVVSAILLRTHIRCSNLAEGKRLL